ncbi:MAG: branched-chain amino acid ABC transporter permease [Candidatus Dormibacteraeota bacterium]|uniref:Branched-chain amino acid ABC transporter permease n=1 Tax=Candidatus Amunia macphersoniae TaxID=3127014 RepID=A0A934KHH6_9BACT|nr:branched-chain amino acid ABC transporter permease [Candidatus Dormibacteraeota bacterium]
MSDETTASAARATAGAIGHGTLVDPRGLSARTDRAGTTRPAVVRTLAFLRKLYGLVQRYFPQFLIAGIAFAILKVYANGGLTLMGAQIKNALVLGAIYALVAIGYTMVYGIIELINFAHGDVFTLSGFYAFVIAGLSGGAIGSLATHSGIGLLLALLIIFPTTMVAAGFTGVVIERVAYRRLRDAPRLAPLITAIGVSFLLEGLMLVIFGADNRPTKLSSWITGRAVRVAGVDVNWKDIFVVATALGLMFSLGAFVRITTLGKAMRATAQDRSASLLSGINVNRTISATFFIGSALAAAGAIVYSINYDLIQWNLGYQLGIIAFTAAVLGGIGNIVGAGVGGFIIGVISVFGGQLAGGEWSNSLVFAILVIILTFRPVGLFGVDVTTRA